MNLEERIKELALEIAPDYPGIDKCDAWEQLYAIHASYQGASLACDDLHDLIGHMQEQLGWSNERLMEAEVGLRRTNRTKGKQ